MTKQALRELMKHAKSKEGKAEDAMAETLLKSPLLQCASKIYAFIPLKSEVDITPILDAFPIALPRCTEAGHMEFLKVAQPWKNAIRKGSLGVWEPKEGEVAIPDSRSVILVPGLAFDRQGYRLGRGGGYYDRYLSRYPQLVSIGICHSWQLVEKVPCEPHDKRVTHLYCGFWVR